MPMISGKSRSGSSSMSGRSILNKSGISARNAPQSLMKTHPLLTMTTPPHYHDQQQTSCPKLLAANSDLLSPSCSFSSESLSASSGLLSSPDDEHMLTCSTSTTSSGYCSPTHSPVKHKKPNKSRQLSSKSTLNSEKNKGSICEDKSVNSDRLVLFMSTKWTELIPVQIETTFFADDDKLDSDENKGGNSFMEEWIQNEIYKQIGLL